MVAYDLRGHGQTKGPIPAKLSIQELCHDASSLIEIYHSENPSAAVFIIGHSLGGAIATKLAAEKRLRVQGVVVIDIVEETALAALAHMPKVLALRPKTFSDVEAAVSWAIKSRSYRSRETAEISFSAQHNIKKNDGSLELITDLMASETHWPGWFQGLSQQFVSLPISRLLVLAERDYLDNTLLIGQMQGKFQLEIVHDSGHAIQEDQPEKLAALVSTFVNRNMTIFGKNSANI